MPQIKLRGIHKRYGDCISNADVNLDVRQGTIRGILGENGAGKSTAMKILYGLVEPDGGEIWIDGVERKLKSPHDAKALGIGMLHQHFMLSEAQNVIENIVLGQEPTHPALAFLPLALRALKLGDARSRLDMLMREHGLPVNLDARISDLSVGARQRVEILRLLYIEAKILILDEPTAVLTPQEVGRFFVQLRALADQGKTILIVTHKLKELMAITDSITIFRAGKTITTVETKDTDADQLAMLMIGSRLETVKNSHDVPRSAELALQIEELELNKTAPRRCTLNLRRGEILGIAGVEGNGQHELVEALRHPSEFLKHHEVKVLKFMGQDVRHWKTGQMIETGLGCIPADRHEEGLLLARNAVQNFILGHQNQKSFRAGPFIRWSAVRRATEEGMASCAVVPKKLDLELSRFSGGNQQKLIFAREIHHRPKLLIAFHPTRGVDIGAINLIHKKLLELRAEGLAILLISSELDEILALSDRIAVLENFAIAKTFDGGACDETALGLAMTGAQEGRQHGL